jgi:tocopherol cyclase
VWTQSNHFEREGISLTASVARIPWLTGAFRGFLIGLLLDGRLHTFTTWDGGRIEAMSVDERRVCNRDLRLEIRSHRAPGAVLHAPYDRQMIERVAESMTSEIDLRASRTADDGGVFEGRGRHACLEIQGDLQTLLDG